MTPQKGLQLGSIGFFAVLMIVGGVALAGPQRAQADTPQQEETPLKGNMFVTLASGSTFEGTLPSGKKFHVYFLSGGVATYIDEDENQDVGRWRIRPDDSAICVYWKEMRDGEEHCATATLEGNHLTLDGNSEVGEITVIGTIVTGFE